MFRKALDCFKTARDRALIGFAGLLTGLALTAAVAQGVGPLVVQNGSVGGPSISGIGDNTTGIYFGTNRVGTQGHLEAAARNIGTGASSQPTLSACGTTPGIATGTSDTAGTVTMGTTATGCVITFGTAFALPPSCTVTWRATPLASQSYVVAAGNITLTQTSTSNNLIDYVCIAKSGG